MANTARKARKREGIPFVRESKVGTPVADRSVGAAVDRQGRTAGPIVNHISNRGVRKLVKRILFTNSFKEESE